MECCCCSLVLAAIAVAVVTWYVWAWLQGRRLVGGLGERYVLVTGCDTGFGQRLARRLDSMGVHTFAACLTHQGAQALKAESSKRLVTLVVDVTKDQDIEKALRDVNAALPAGKGA